MKLRIWVTLAGFFTLTGYAIAQPTMLKNGEALRIQSTVLQEERNLLVHTPDAYEESSEGYPVLIVLDGEWSFRTAVAITEHLAASGRMPAMIVVGITNTMRNGRPSRLADLTPTGPGDVPGGASGGAALFRQFILEEALPFVDQNYNTSAHRVLAGHSLGGLFVVNTLLEVPEAFAAHIAISPSLGRNNQQQVQRARELLEEPGAFAGLLHISMGSEGGNTLLGVRAFIHVIEKQAPPSMHWQMKHFNEEDHVSVVHHALYDALEWIYDGWQVPEELLTDYDISIVERHYATLSERLGFKVEVPEQYYARMGYRILAEHEFEYAQWTFEQYQDTYPESVEALVGLADVALMQGAFDEARKYYEQALEISPFNARAAGMMAALK